MEENKKDVLPLEGEPLTTPQISEPVVNALAAALNKIETYVPTQYINDGPPDIDAEHLNHAEQAIMRVTNLANGAADAISALQSQVTQLNNNLGYYITSTDDFSHTLIGEVRKNITLNSKITLGQYTRVLFMNIPNSKDGALLAIAPGNNIITAFRNNGVWEEKSSHFIATKSDLFSNPIRVTDVHNIGKSCLFRAEYGSANTPTSDLGYIGISIYISSNWQFVICSPYAGGKLFFDSVNTDGSWIGWKEIVFK